MVEIKLNQQSVWRLIKMLLDKRWRKSETRRSECRESTEGISLHGYSGREGTPPRWFQQHTRQQPRVELADRTTRSRGALLLSAQILSVSQKIRLNFSRFQTHRRGGLHRNKLEEIVYADMETPKDPPVWLDWSTRDYTKLIKTCDSLADPIVNYRSRDFAHFFS